MIELMNTSRSARENLAKALAALQSPGVPPQLSAVAEPVAQAMNALHQIETSQGALAIQAGPTALDAVRRALGQLQAQPVPHAAVSQATEAVASSLGMVHQIVQRLASAPAPAAQPAVAAQPGYGAQAQQYQQPQPAQPQWAPPANAGAQQAAPMYQQPAPGSFAAAAAAAQKTQASAPQPDPFKGTMVMPETRNAQRQAAPQQAHTAHQHAHPAPQAQPAQAAAFAGHHVPPRMAAAAVPAGPSAAHGAQQGGPRAAYSGPDGQPLLRVDAELGAHSATNFYKGLSGNDVIDSGGIFIATYNIAKIGTPLAIKVSLPGGYEFDARGVVRWTREASPSDGADSSPGYGAQFTDITAEGRQLVYRYVRNREPLFHDDL